MRVKAYKLKNSRFDKFLDEWKKWDYKDFLEKPDYFHNWISFDCLLADDKRNTIWCGLTCFDTNIFYGFNINNKTFRSMGYNKIADRYDAKFHRSLLMDNDGTIWAATALLHDIDRWDEAPGGSIVRFNPETEKIKRVCQPLPHHYIQSIDIDKKRNIIYGVTFTPEKLFSYEMKTGKVKNLGLTGSGASLAQNENIVVDKKGRVWAFWSVARAWLPNSGPDAVRLCYFDPDKNKIIYLDYGLPLLNGERGYAHGDGLHLGPDGKIYAGSSEGGFFVIDPDTPKIKKIGKPGPKRRLAAMANGPDGKIYGAAGNEGTAMIFSYDPTSKELKNLGQIYDKEIKENAYQIHCIAITSEGTIYAGENDVPCRSGYLWECKI